MDSKRINQLKAFDRLLTIMDELRTNCPWDKKQTFASLRHLTIEETYELSEALLSGDLNEVKNELGDLLLHIVFYAKIGSEQEAFDIADVANGISEKLIERHPHVYGDVAVNDESDVKKNWEKLKLKEGKKGVLSGVPKSLPSLVMASRMQDKAAGIGFDWKTIDGIKEKDIFILEAPETQKFYFKITDLRKTETFLELISEAGNIKFKDGYTVRIVEGL